ncbi:uncharacterized protein LOC115627262 [Scaptodrosophila lebanonensis]|uniref:Uncharacterized protein LOC115627262 n=1 Tax=Drosophila lebanonensis TaxID=7225 RepID=A0A6J2TT46_DROLE|nr:uncharacterized protein LOC115627262 [Scaptodrosophila lebanonensis]
MLIDVPMCCLTISCFRQCNSTKHLQIAATKIIACQMRNLLVPQAGASGGTDFEKKDALLGFALDLPDEQLDTAVLQLQAAGHSLQQHNNNNSAADYHSQLLQCVDLLPPMSEATPLSGVYRTSAVQDYHETYSFDGNAGAATELVNVANKDCDSLSKLAYNLWRMAKEDHIVIDRKRNEVVRTNALTNQKTIYRCMDPVGMCMRKGTAAATTPPKPSATKVGRPRKRTATASGVSENSISAPVSKMEPTEPTPQPSTDATLRTRSGRIVRTLITPPTSHAPGPVPASAQQLDSLLSDLKDKDYRCNSAAPTTDIATDTVPSPSPAERPGRTVPENSICPGCNKIFLGRRLKRHFVQYPEHMQRATPTTSQIDSNSQSNSTLFGLLTAQLQRHSHLSEEQRADLFLHELNDFVEQLQLRSTRLIRNTSGLHFVNARIARVLGIPEGQYALDMSAMESALAPAPEPEPSLLHASTVAGTRSNLVDYPGLSMSLDDTLTDEAAQRLNLSAGGKLLPPSEESLLRNVSDLMQPPVAVPTTVGGHVAGVNGAGVGALLPHYDHVSDNAVEALNMKETPNAAILDLNVDFFQFQQ